MQLMAALSKVSLLAVAVAFCAWASPAGAAEAGARRKPIHWSLVQVGPDQRSVEVSVRYGGCEGDPVGTATEAANSIRIKVTVESPTDPHAVCPAIARIRDIAVPLKARLAGRRIDEAAMEPSARVPRLVGLAPADANRLALADGLFRVRTRRVHAHVPRPVVREQSPAAGASVPGSATVRLVVALPSS
jgi:hypothetical protein